VADIYHDGRQGAFRLYDSATDTADWMLERDGANSANVDGDVGFESPHMLEGGTRVVLTFGDAFGDAEMPEELDGGTDGYSVSGNHGLPMTRAGSVTGLAVDCKVNTVAVEGVLQADVYKCTDGGSCSSILAIDSAIFTSGNLQDTWSTTQARDTSGDTFSAEDMLLITIDEDAGDPLTFTGTTLCTASLEVVFDG
jgi:hypothetical protein